MTADVIFLIAVIIALATPLVGYLIGYYRFPQRRAVLMSNYVKLTGVLLAGLIVLELLRLYHILP